MNYCSLRLAPKSCLLRIDLSFEKRFYNGKMGVIIALSDEEILVSFPEEGATVFS